MKIILAGLIGQSGLGGQAWSDMQYLAGFRELGHGVYYVEDCGATRIPVYNWNTEEFTDELDPPAAFIQSCLEPLELGDNWIYRAGDETRGMRVDDFRQACIEADLLIMRAVPIYWREEYTRPRRRAFIDVDPGFTQVTLAEGNAEQIAGVSRCERHFTVGQRIGFSDCPIPTAGFDWQPTLPPVALSSWPYAGKDDASHFTSIMTWRGFRDAEYKGVSYGQKDRQFPRYVDLPRQTTQPFRLAIMGVEPEVLTPYGWEVVPSWVISRTPRLYRDFIQDSRAEFGVPKHGYAATRSGWFSDRSVCYLASGRPVLVGDTGIGECLTTGRGLLTFSDPAQALAGIDEINSDYSGHRRAARALAEESFAADKVLPAFLHAALD